LRLKNSYSIGVNKWAFIGPEIGELRLCRANEYAVNGAKTFFSGYAAGVIDLQAVCSLRRWLEG